METNIEAQIQEYCAYIQAWNASYEEYAKSVGLSFTSLSILSALFSTENCTQKMLCEHCFLPKQTVNAVVTSFYKKGWVTLRELPEDRRNKTIHFTEAGYAEAERIMRRVRESEQAAMRCMSAEDREALLKTTKQYILSCKNAMMGSE